MDKCRAKIESLTEETPEVEISFDHYHSYDGIFSTENDEYLEIRITKNGYYLIKNGVHPNNGKAFSNFMLSINYDGVFIYGETTFLELPVKFSLELLGEDNQPRCGVSGIMPLDER